MASSCPLGGGVAPGTGGVEAMIVPGKERSWRLIKPGSDKQTPGEAEVSKKSRSGYCAKIGEIHLIFNWEKKKKKRKEGSPGAGNGRRKKRGNTLKKRKKLQSINRSSGA